MKLIIEDDEGRRTVVPFVDDKLTIGRHEANLVRLTEKNVSRKHGRLLREADRFFIEDLNSFTGIRVNGERIAGKRLVREGDLIQISEYDLSLQAGPEEKTAPSQPGAPAAGEVREGASARPPRLPGVTGSGVPVPLPGRTGSGPPPRLPGLTGSGGIPVPLPGLTGSGAPPRLPGVTGSGLPPRLPGLAGSGPPNRLPGLAGLGRPQEPVPDAAPIPVGKNDLEVEHQPTPPAESVARAKALAAAQPGRGGSKALLLALGAVLLLALVAVAFSRKSKGERTFALSPASEVATGQKPDAAASGSARQHLAAARRMLKDKDRAGCLAEAKLALQANPRSAEARSLAEACKLSPPAAAPGAHASAVAAQPAPVATAAASPRTDIEARKLVSDGNEKLVGEDFDSAIAAYQKALAMKPGDGVLSGLYRSMGIAYTRQGNLEDGARYYKLYLPLCTDPNERAQLQKLLADYEARRR